MPSRWVLSSRQLIMRITNGDISLHAHVWRKFILTRGSKDWPLSVRSHIHQIIRIKCRCQLLGKLYRLSAGVGSSLRNGSLAAVSMRTTNTSEMNCSAMLPGTQLLPRDLRKKILDYG